MPDKLASSYNYNLGWAHTYSLPREWSLDANGQLIQRPYAGLEAMRDLKNVTTFDNEVDGYETLTEMRDRQIELVGEFTVSDADFGFGLYSEYGDGALLYYSPRSSRLVLDARQLVRWNNDRGSFNGLYTTALPEAVKKGSVMKMQVFVDHSIVDIFINDRWATSVRLFATENAAETVEVFSEGGATPVSVKAYNLDSTASGIDDIFADNKAERPFVDVYSMTGIKLRHAVARAAATEGLPAGLYIVDRQKVLVR